MMTYEFLVSVVIPVYQVEQYLAETLDSVLAQTIGMEHIQIILVNDGSTDGSEAICLHYRERYPDNIVYVKKENGGVSSARNEGIRYIKGRYVNFLDSDDKWCADAFAHMTALLEDDRTDVVCARKCFFAGRDGWHHLDYKFAHTEIADLTKRPDCIQLDVTAALIRTEAIGDRRFSVQLKYGEDAAFINTILLDKRTLGVCREAVHFYRKRQDDSSALQNELKSRSYYFDSPVYFHTYLMELSRQKYGHIEPFIQYTVMYDLSWRVRKQLKDCLSEEDFAAYCNIIIELLRQINDKVILRQTNLWKKQKLYCLLKKRGLHRLARLYRKISKTTIMFE